MIFLPFLLRHIKTAGVVTRYNLLMGRFRKFFLVCLVGIVVIVLVFFNHPLVDRYSEPNQLGSEFFETERLDANQIGSQDVQSGNDEQDAPQPTESQATTELLREIVTTSDHVTLSGWVGTEFGEIVGGETVVLHSPSQKTHYSMDTSASGEYKITDIKPGWDYILKVTPRGQFNSYTKTQLKLSADQEVQNIILEPISLGTLTGRIVDPYDRPVTGLELFVTTVEKEYMTTNVVTDTNGDFSVAEFPKGKFQVATRGQHTIKATGLIFDPGTNVPFILTIDHGPYNLRGDVFDESGQTFDGTDVILIRAIHKNGISMRSTRKVSTDARGEFRFNGLGPGKHELVVSAWRRDTFKKTIRKTVNVGVDSGELIVLVNTL